MKASDLIQQEHYPNFPEFRKYAIDLSLTDAEVILTLQRLRNVSRVPMTPSPLQGAWSRTTGSKTSRHYAIGRLADAGDFFPRRGRALYVWTVMQQLPEINGIGLYSDKKGPDGKPQIMIHMDLRTPTRIFWVTDKNGNYWSLHKNQVPFWKTFKTLIDMDN